MHWTEFIIAIGVTLGVRELAGRLISAYFDRRRLALEQDALDLSVEENRLLVEENRIDFLDKLTDQVERLMAESTAHMRTIEDLKASKIEDDRKIARRDGVIEEQRLELQALHNDVAELRIRLKEMERRIDACEAENKELVKENAQLKGMIQEHAGKSDDSG